VVAEGVENRVQLAFLRELGLRYQPLMELATGAVVGVEALLHWRHPRRGLVKPKVFIPLAEESGLIGAIGRQVLEQACQQAGVWRRAGLQLRMCVNFSGRQLATGQGIDELEALLSDNGLDPSGLTLEITEGLMTEARDETLGWLERICALGIGLALDDFGTGHSSLGYLKRYPVDTLKIDRSFVHGLPHEEEDVALVQGIVAMAHGLKLRVVAEGVENRVQLAFLRELGCDIAQGYLFSRAVVAEEVPELVRRLSAQGLD